MIGPAANAGAHKERKQKTRTTTRPSPAANAGIKRQRISHQTATPPACGR